MPYAERTSVSPEQSRGEIERTLRRYGADAFSYGYEGDRAIIAFRAHERYVRFELKLKDRQAREFIRDRYGYSLAESTAQKKYDQHVRQRWRALLLTIKAKLEAVESGITSFEEEFLAHILLPDRTTAGEWMLPQIEQAYATGEMPTLLPTARPALEEGGDG